MHVHYNLNSLPDFRNAVITIGTFDGVHTGHAQLIEQLTTEAAKINGESVIITFDPHPRKILGKSGGDIKLINTTQEKIELFEDKGIDQLVIVPFTQAFSQMTADEYVRDFLVAKFHPHTIVIGYDHRFGQGRKGDYQMLETMSEPMRFRLFEIPVHVLNTISVSSTRIREAITTADMDTANKLLGYDFFFEGTVVEGNKLGRTIGYPTANISLNNGEKLIPGDGVYAVQVELIETYLEGSTASPKKTSAHLYNGMMNIGMRPTVGGTSRTIEVNLFDFDTDIYGRTLRIHVRKYIRGEQRFSGLEALKAQLANDRESAIRILEAK